MLLAVGSLDRESRDTYDLVVKASDRGSPQREVRQLPAEKMEDDMMPMKLTDISFYSGVADVVSSCMVVIGRSQRSD